MALAVALLAASVAGPPAFAQQSSVPYGVVSLEVTRQGHEATMPWNKDTEQIIRGNALVVASGLLLTSADVVKNATLIEARKFGRYPNYQAHARLVDYELDLALLEVDDDAFWAGLAPIPISREPMDFSRFLISRWRPNGRFEQGSGEVVDLRTTSSRFGTMELPILRGTTNMAGLGWGEAMTVNDEVVGLITAHGDQQIQATVAPVLTRFVEAARQERYEGFAHRGFSWQQLNHPALRRYHDLADDQDLGVLITKTFFGGTGAQQLREGDILMRLGPHEIDPEGVILHPLYGPMLFTLAINDGLSPTLTAEVMRDGEPLTLELQRTRFTPRDYRIPAYHFDRPVDYEVFGGLVVQELSLSYLQAWGGDWQQRAPNRLVVEYALNAVLESDESPERVLIVSTVLPDPVNLGYQNLDHAILTHANGRALDSLQTFREAIQAPEGGHHVIEVMPGQGRRRVIFDDADIDSANERIATRYAIPEPPGSEPLSSR